MNHLRKGWGGTPAPKVVTKPDYHFATLKQFTDAVDAAFAAKG